MSDDLERRAAYGAQVHAEAEARQRELATRPVTPAINALATQALIKVVKTRGLDTDALVFLVTLLAVA